MTKATERPYRILVWICSKGRDPGSLFLIAKPSKIIKNKILKRLNFVFLQQQQVSMSVRV